MKNPEFRSKARAIREGGITRNRLDQAIEHGEVEAIYTGTRTVKVRMSDVLRLLSTPPTKAPSADTAPREVA